VAAAAALIVTALLLALLPAAAGADSPFCSQKTMTIVAHQDDDLLFQSPDLLETIAGGGCVRTVFVTAGDAGLGSAYWHEREEGSRAAYAMMAAVPNTWSNSEETFAGHRLHVATLAGDPGLSEVYMRLPNGGRTGAGYPATGNVSLPKLWRSHNPQPSNLTPINELSALDGSATYTYESLLATLKALIAEYEPDVILTQDYVEEFNATDHGDHIVTARLTKLADGSYPAEHELRSYMDYRTAEEPVNVFEPQLARKTQVFNAYRAHDPQICLTETECKSPDPDYNEWLKRQIVVAKAAVPGANAGPDQAVASKAAVTLNGSGSSDPLGHTLHYTWNQTGGPAVTLSNSHAVKPSFTAPTGPATLTFSLVVNSSEASSMADTVAVTVAAPKFALSVSTSGNGSGTVTSSPVGISCPSDCEGTYEQGTKVTLTPTPAAGSEFKGWDGACAGSGACEVTMSAAKSVEAEFALQRHALTVTKSGAGSGTVTSSPAGISCGATCAASFDHGIEVTLTAAPAAGSEFKGWSGACAGSGSCKVAISAAKSVGAEFAPVPKFNLAVSSQGNGSGTVTSSPAGISCGSDCEQAYEQGTKVTLSPSPAAGSEFKGWGGACAGAGACEVTMSAARSVSAEFALQRHALTVTKSGAGSGTVTSSPAGISCGATCAASFDHGTLVKLTGAPGPNSKAVVWESCPGTVNASNQCEVTISAAKAVTAVFALESHQLTVVKNGSGTGTITSSPAGISCGSECQASFTHGALITLAGAPGPNAKPVVWQTCPGTVNASNQCEVAMTAAKEAVASFNLESHQLSVERKGTGPGTVTSAPAGINCGTECAAAFNHGTVVKLTGAPAAGSKAATWSGCDKVNGANECEVTMSAVKAVTATFDLESHLLTVTKSGAGSGTVTSSPAGISCGATCAASFDHGIEVTLTAAPAAGSEFKGWSGACAGSGSCKVAMSAAKSVGAEFAPVPKFALSVSTSGNGSGTVTSSPAGISCPSDCEQAYEQGTKVTLSPSPAAGSEFKGWSGACAGAGACEVTMSAARSVSAEFALQRHALTVTKSGAGSGTVTSSPAGISCGATCGAAFDHGTEVTLTATPAAGSFFVGWSGACAGSGTCKVTMSSAKSVGVEFALVPKFNLAVSTQGNGSGTVTSSPAGINCPADCEQAYEQGTKVTLSPSPAAGSEFKGWSGACAGAGACEVTMSAARSVSAEFALQRHALTVTKSGAGSGTVTSSPAGISCGAACGAAFDHGTLVKLAAAPAADSEPAVWTGCDQVNGSNECEVTMGADEEVVASFPLLHHAPMTVTKIGSGAGTVTSSPAGIDCGSECTAEYLEGTVVTLAGAAGFGSKDVVWEACPGTVNASNQCEATMSQARSATARFDLERHPLVVTKTGSGSATVTSSPAGIDCGVNCSASFDHGTEVTLSAAPAAGSTVVWSGCDQVVDGDRCKVSMDAASQVSATVNSPPAPPLPSPSPEPTPIPAPDPLPSAPPNTKLLKAKVAPGTATFVFAAQGNAPRFRCALAPIGLKLTYKNCSSPRTYRHLAPGAYVFKVKAVGTGGADPEPITRRFRVADPFSS
jgi:LmbE family N-acetylglucosaminyl deacetylase